MNLLKKIFKNKVIVYLGSRYFTYALQFLNSILIALYLGPYYLGIWGFILLTTEYIGRTNFGISNAVSAISSVHKEENNYVSKILGMSIILLLVLSLVVICFFLLINNVSTIGSKYDFKEFMPFVLVIGLVGYFNILFSNIFRVYGRISEITFFQSLKPITVLLVILCFREQNLMWWLLMAQMVSASISLIVFITTCPVKISFKLEKKTIKLILKKGFYLFLYNSSFYLILITTRTFVTQYYEVQEFGFVTFALTLANAIQLLFASVSFLIFPKIINRFSKGNNDQAIKLLSLLRNSYVTLSHLFIHVAILAYPILIMFFKEYKSTGVVFGIVALTVVLYTNSYGYTGLIIAKHNEKILGIASFIILLINLGINYFLAVLIKVSYEYVMFSTLISYLMFVYVVTYLGRKEIGLKVSFLQVIKDALPIKWMLPFVVSLITNLYFSTNEIMFIIPVFLFLILNRKDFYNIKELVVKIIKNPNIINI